MPYKDVYLVAVDTDFWHAVAIAAIDYCGTVAGEVAGTPNHANRVKLMQAIAGDPDYWGRKMAYGVAMLGGTVASTDAQLKTFVGSVFNAYSGVP